MKTIARTRTDEERVLVLIDPHLQGLPGRPFVRPYYYRDWQASDLAAGQRLSISWEKESIGVYSRGGDWS